MRKNINKLSYNNNREYFEDIIIISDDELESKWKNIMVKIKNIKANNVIISAEYAPENSNEVGKISIDRFSGKVIEKLLTEADKICPIYFHKTLTFLQEIKTLNNIPEEKTIMWY